MYLEKEKENIKWFKENELRIKLKNLGEESEIWVTLNKYNISLKLIMFDFVLQVKRDLTLDISIKKVLDRQRVFIINSSYALELVDYISEFISEWNIKDTLDTVSESDIILNEFWYE